MDRWREDREKSVRDMLFVNRPKPYDSGASGELNIESLAWSPRRTSWGDRQRWRLEDRLRHLLRELETQADEAEERRQAKEREAAERQRQWEAAIADAKRRLALDHKVKLLREGVAAWSEAEAIRAYCTAIQERYESELVDDQRAAAWLSFAHRYADELQQLPRTPDDPEATPEALKPYLGGWSPYGPHG